MAEHFLRHGHRFITRSNRPDFQSHYYHDPSREETSVVSSNSYRCPTNSHLPTGRPLLINARKADDADSLGIVADKPRYTRYSTVDARLRTFESWPTSKKQDKADLSYAGFVYSGKEDIVQCYHCGISLKDWPPMACPWEQHVIASPSCGHVKLCKGINYIARVLNQTDCGNSVDDSCDVIDIAQVAMQRNPIAIEAAREYCTDDELRRAVKILVKNDPNTTFNAENLIRLIQEEHTTEESGEVLALAKQRADPRKEYNESKTMEDIETDSDELESEDDMEETNRKLKDPVTCKICYSALSCVITLPCGHMVCCPQCVSALTKCAMCRAQIKGTVRALMAV